MLQAVAYSSFHSREYVNEVKVEQGVAAHGTVVRIMRGDSGAR
jgi:hypothetical protein